MHVESSETGVWSAACCGLVSVWQSPHVAWPLAMAAITAGSELAWHVAHVRPRFACSLARLSTWQPVPVQPERPVRPPAWALVWSGMGMWQLAQFAPPALIAA